MRGTSSVQPMNCMQTLELPPEWPSQAFSSTSTLEPRSAAVMAVAQPAPPRPTTTTSCSASQSTVVSNGAVPVASVAEALAIPAMLPMAAAAAAPATNCLRLTEVLKLMVVPFIRVAAPLVRPPLVTAHTIRGWLGVRKTVVPG